MENGELGREFGDESVTVARTPWTSRCSEIDHVWELIWSSTSSESIVRRSRSRDNEGSSRYEFYRYFEGKKRSEMLLKLILSQRDEDRFWPQALVDSRDTAPFSIRAPRSMTQDCNYMFLYSVAKSSQIPGITTWCIILCAPLAW